MPMTGSDAANPTPLLSPDGPTPYDLNGVLFVPNALRTSGSPTADVAENASMWMVLFPSS